VKSQRDAKDAQRRIDPVALGQEGSRGWNESRKGSAARFPDNKPGAIEKKDEPHSRMTAEGKRGGHFPGPAGDPIDEGDYSQI